MSLLSGHSPCLHVTLFITVSVALTNYSLQSPLLGLLLSSCPYICLTSHPVSRPPSSVIRACLRIHTLLRSLPRMFPTSLFVPPSSRVWSICLKPVCLVTSLSLLLGFYQHFSPPRLTLSSPLPLPCMTELRYCHFLLLTCASRLPASLNTHVAHNSSHPGYHSIPPTLFLSSFLIPRYLPPSTATVSTTITLPPSPSPSLRTFLPSTVHDLILIF